MIRTITRKCSKLVLISMLCLIAGATMKLVGGNALEPTASILLGISGMGIILAIFAEAIA